jgi:hypothetical protein
MANYLWQNPFRLVARPQGQLKDADAFVLLGFGLVESENGRPLPGAGNQSLAEWVVAHNPLRLPTITQEGTYLALKEMELADPSLEVDHWAINLPHDSRVHVDTYGAALQVWLIFNNTGICRPVLVTHPYQSERARRIFSKLPLAEVIIPPIDTTTIPFIPESKQRWTRNRFWYTIFEFLLARPIGYLFGWL